MNAAARLAQHNIVARHLLTAYLLTRQQIAMVFLAVALLLSALSVIYVSHLNRLMHANLQHYAVERNNLLIERSQLLLERGTGMMQARIQQIAENKLGMIIPDHKSVVIIHE